MRLDDFINDLYLAGWKPDNDAQWHGVAAFHKKLFPVIAELEETIKDLENELFETQELLYD